MTRATMSGRQRVQRMFQRKDQDRLPRAESFWPDTIRRWTEEGLVGGAAAVLDRLDCDFACLAHWCAPFPGHREVVTEDEQTITLVNEWQETVKEWKGRSGTPEHLGWGCDTREKWERTFKPAMRALTHEDVSPDVLRQRAGEATAKGRWPYLATLESFEALRHLLGDVGTAIAMADDPEWVAEMSREWTDTMLRRMDVFLTAGIEIDGVWCYGDMAFNHATMCSPAMYRQIIWPDHKRMADWAHDHGVPFIYHTDGNVNGVLELYIEAGFDCLQPLEAKAGMDVRRLCPTYGDRMAFFGNIDVMTMATNDPAKIEAEIVEKFAAGKASKAYAYHSDHSVPPSVSWQTYQHIIELVDKHGWYD